MARVVFVLRMSTFILCLYVSTVYIYYAVRTSEKVPSRSNRACTIPTLDPWDITVNPYIKPVIPIRCPNRPSLMYVDDNGYLVYNRSVVSKYSFGSLACVYQVVHIQNDRKLVFDTETVFEPPVFVNARVFRVVCKDETGRTVYSFIHVNVAWNDSATTYKNIGHEKNDKLSIIILGIDSMSRSHAIRNLPLSYKYITNTIGAYDFQGYTKVGENSLPNLLPMLTGKGVDLLEKGIYDFHNYSFIWERNIMEHYATLYSEDRPHISTFNFRGHWFEKPPTDYYYRPYSLAMHKERPIIGTVFGRSPKVCYGNKEHLFLQFDFLKQFVTKYAGSLKFACFWNNQLSHNHFNTLQLGDAQLLGMLKWLHEGNHLKKAVLIVVSDHGFRLGGFSTTYTGRLENNMPFLALYLPDVVKQEHTWIHGAMTRNTKRLVTAYDIHETMMRIVNASNMWNNAIPDENHLVGRSLFSDIPDDRTCEDAGIPPNYCTCTDRLLLDAQSVLAKFIAHNVTTAINTLVSRSQYRLKCHNLELLNVSEVALLVYSNSDNTNMSHGFQPENMSEHEESLQNNGRYNVLFYTSPNKGLFQVMVDYMQSGNGVSGNIVIVGKPRRLDEYGTQASCVKGSDIEEYCFCIEQNVKRSRIQ